MRKSIIAGAVVALAATALSGCASTTDRPASAPSPVFSGHVPAFSGPWAAEFERAYRSTTSDIVHRILAKGSITDRDYAAVSGAYERCMANKGFPTRVTGPAGEAETQGGEESLKADEACNGDFAVIASLRANILRNPQHLNEDEIVAACLVDKGLAPKSYTVKDYETNLQSQSFPFSIDDPRFTKCTTDPLGLSSER